MPTATSLEHAEILTVRANFRPKNTEILPPIIGLQNRRKSSDADRVLDICRQGRINMFSRKHAGRSCPSHFDPWPH